MTVNKSLYQKRASEMRSDIVFGAVAAVLLFIIAVAVFIGNTVYIRVMVDGASMQPTLYGGRAVDEYDIVFANVLREPSYGDILVISGEKANGDWLIKRAIAFGGDTVKIEGGYVFIKKAGETEFTKLENEPYLANNGITFWNDVRASGWEIEEGQIFYLGDNRTNSSDSRVYGTCDRSQIVGVVSDFAVKMKGVNKFFEKLLIPFRRLFGLPVGKTD